MIAKNEADNLPRSLAHARAFHRTIVIDTGSTDGTQEIARSMGAEVFDFTWVDDFSAARNEWHKYVDSGWIFWLDADDEIDGWTAQQILMLGSTEPDDTVGLLFDYKYPNDFVVEHIRMYRVGIGIKWQNRIHEHLNFLDLPGGKIARSHLTVLHPGYPTYDAAENRKRAERNYRLLLKQLEEKPNDALTLHYIAEHHAFEGDLEQAVDVYKRVLQLADDTEVFWLPGCYVDMARCYYKMGRKRQAKKVLQSGYNRFGKDFEVHVDRSLSLKGKDGITAYEKARSLRERVTSMQG